MTVMRNGSAVMRSLIFLLQRQPDQQYVSFNSKRNHDAIIVRK